MSTLIVICGLSFSGKSTLARAIAERLGFHVIDVDEVGAALYGAPADADDWDFDRVYDEADLEIERLLAGGIDVVDASRNFTRAERARARRLADRANARLLTIFVDTPEGVAGRRRNDNRSSGARRDIADGQFEEIVRVFQPPAEDESALVFSAGDDVHSWIATNATGLRQR